MGPRHLRKLIIALYVLTVLGFSVFSRAATMVNRIGSVHSVGDAIVLSAVAPYETSEKEQLEFWTFTLKSERDLRGFVGKKVVVSGLVEGLDKKVGPMQPMGAEISYDDNQAHDRPSFRSLNVVEITQALF